eukprot:3499275-Karenia_brevis.AAC.1
MFCHGHPQHHHRHHLHHHCHRHHRHPHHQHHHHLNFLLFFLGGGEEPDPRARKFNKTQSKQLEAMQAKGCTAGDVLTAHFHRCEHGDMKDNVPKFLHQQSREAHAQWLSIVPFLSDAIAQQKHIDPSGFLEEVSFAADAIVCAQEKVSVIIAEADAFMNSRND